MTGTLAPNGVPPGWLPVTFENLDVTVSPPRGPGVRLVDLRDRLVAAGWRIDESSLDSSGVIGFTDAHPHRHTRAVQPRQAPRMGSLLAGGAWWFTSYPLCYWLWRCAGR